MKLVRCAVVAGALLAGPASGQDVPDERAQWEQVQKENARFREQQFAEAGFAAIDDVRAAKRDVRRMILRDPYGFLPIPAVEIERKADGEAVVTLQYWAWREGPVAIDRANWRRIEALDAAAFQPEHNKPPRKYAPGEEPGVCHGWMAHLQSSSGKTAGWWQCQQGPGANLSLVRAIAEAALKTRPDCKVDEDPLWSFAQCFQAKDELDDPKLEAVYSVLRKEYYAVPGADRLMEARIALKKPGMKLGNAEWREARAAVAKFRETMDARRDRLQRLIELEHGAKDASAADKAKLRRAVLDWSQFVQSGWTVYSEVLERLAWAAE